MVVWTLRRGAARSLMGRASVTVVDEADRDWEPTVTRSGGVERSLAGLDDEQLAADVAHIGRFEVLGLLGEGGMGRVYVGYDEPLDRKVAIKLLRGRSSEARSHRLIREAQALARLSHPNVVQVHEAGVHEGALFMAMELVDGKTLGTWSAEPGRSWQARLEALIQAGRGLAAAHAAGLVHRDVKPDNVLVGRDGRVRVLDFGLARDLATARIDAEGEETLVDEPGEGAGEGAADASEDDWTLIGAVVGTPRYMAPEQHAGRASTPATDQFGFCVTAFEILFGRAPFEHAPLRELELAKQSGAIVAVPEGSPVPSVVRSALLRGLAAEPSERWPSLDALLDALEGQPKRRPRRLLAAAAVGFAGLAAAASLAWMAAAPKRPTCSVDEAALAGVWDEPRRSALRSSYAASSVPDASRLGGRIIAELDAWTEEWLATQKASCRATRVAGTQSERVMDRRAACLEARLGEAGAVVDVLARAEPGVLARAAALLRELPDLDDCTAAALSQSDPLPAALSRLEREAVARAFTQLTEARVELRVGRPDRAVELAKAARTLGEGLEHDALTIAAQGVLARVAIVGGELRRGVDEMRAAGLAAERARLYDLAASLQVELARLAAGDLAEPVLERWMIDDAQVALARVARPRDRREVVLEVARARLAEQAGDFPAAIAGYERAYALAEGRMDAAQRALLRMGIGTSLHRLGEHEAARRELGQTLEEVRGAWGPGALEVARIEFNLGVIAADLGESEVARAHLETAIELDTQLWGRYGIEVARDRFALAYLDFRLDDIAGACTIIDAVVPVFERELGPRHDETAQALTASAVCRYFDDDFQAALTGYRRALSVQRELLGDSHVDVGLLHYNIGEALVALGRIDEARGAYERSRAAFVANVDEDDPLLAYPIAGFGRVWLATGRPGAAVEAFERALELSVAATEHELAELHFDLARALMASEGAEVLPRARDLAESALQVFEKAGSRRLTAATREWLTLLPS